MAGGSGAGRKRRCGVAMRRELQQRINAMGPVVEDMVGLLVDRLELGHKTYGEWQKDDDRDLLTEALEEALDLQAYTAVLLLQIRRIKSG